MSGGMRSCFFTEAVEQDDPPARAEHVEQADLMAA
jgi:hypothetical protein